MSLVITRPFDIALPSAGTEVPPREPLFETGRPEDPYIRVGDVMSIHRGSRPTSQYLDASAECDASDCCWLVPADGVGHFSIETSPQAVSYRSVIEAFLRMRRVAERAGRELHRAPARALMVFAPVKLLIRDRENPIFASVTTEPVYPLRAKMAVCDPEASPVWAYLSAGVINSVYGHAYYYRDLRARNQTSKDGVNNRALSEIPLTHKYASRDAVTQAADFAYQIMMIREAERALRTNTDRQMLSILNRLASVIAIDLLQIDDDEAKKLRAEVDHLNLVDSEWIGERYFAGKLMPVPPVRLAVAHSESRRARIWEDKINTSLSGAVGTDWLWTISNNYLRFLHKPWPKWDSQIHNEENPIMSSPELAIQNDPRRCSGHPTVGHTRITVHGIINRLKLYNGNLEAMMKSGEVLASPEQIEAAISHYEANKEEIDYIISEQKQNNQYVREGQLEKIRG